MICGRYPGLKPGTLRSRASREKWATPRNISTKLIERTNHIAAAEMRGELTPGQADRQMTDIEKVAETIAEKQAAHKDVVHNIAKKALSKHRLPKIKSWRDAQIADNMGRKALGMDEDTPDAIINIGVLGGGAVVDDYAPTPEPQPVEV